MCFTGEPRPAATINTLDEAVSLLGYYNLLWDKKQRCKRYGTHFTHEWGEEMCVNTLSQGINFAPRWAESNLGPSDHESKRLPLRHKATLLKVIPWRIYMTFWHS